MMDTDNSIRLIVNVKISNKRENKVMYYLVIMYLIFDYARLHDTFNIGFTRPLMVITLLLIAMIIISGKLFKLKSNQLKFIWLFILLLFLYIPFAHNNFRAYKAANYNASLYAVHHFFYYLHKFNRAVEKYFLC